MRQRVISIGSSLSLYGLLFRTIGIYLDCVLLTCLSRYPRHVRNGNRFSGYCFGNFPVGYSCFLGGCSYCSGCWFVVVCFVALLVRVVTLV